MQGLILGIDLCDDYCQVGYYNPNQKEADSIALGAEGSYMIPTVICKLKNEEAWLIGEDAYRSTLEGKGVSVDKLVSLCLKDGTSTIDGRRYDAVTLLAVYLRKIFEMVFDKLGDDNISKVVFTTRNKFDVISESVKRAAHLAGIDNDRMHFATHSEAYLYYVISQKPDVYTNLACLFDLSDDGLDYYEFAITRGRKPQIAEVSFKELEERFSLDILDSPQGRKIADKILCSCSERLLGKRVVTSVFLTGRGFDTEAWAENFINIICCRRRVFLGQGLFAQGAAYMANEHAAGEKLYPYICICSGRLANRVMLTADYCGQPIQIVVAEAGSNFRETGMDADFILDNTDYVEFGVSGVRVPWQRKLAVPLTGFPKRPNKTTRINVRVWFEDDSTMKIRIADLGFGQFYPASDAVITEELTLKQQ